MKFKFANIGNLKYGLLEICVMDIISKTSYWLGKFQNKVESEYKEYTKQVSKLREKHGKWKYKLEKEVVKDGKPVLKDGQPEKEKIVCTLEGPEGQKYLVDPEGKKVENHETDWNKVYWEANSDEDGATFKEELDALDEMEFEIPFEPIKLSRIVRKVDGGKEEEINIKPTILGMLDGIIVDEEVPVKEGSAA
ncbi:MAG TPA: hypothetical protein VHO03_03610 [Ignavibacteriales bacterium]|nr:hypothetical protein [Ignavibacteriales bacterium]